MTPSDLRKQGGTALTDPELVSRLAQTLIAANRRWRKSFPFGTACVVPPFPDALVRQVAVGLVPLLRDLVREAVADADPARRAA